jgi:hypothetical protein
MLVDRMLDADAGVSFVGIREIPANAGAARLIVRGRPCDGGDASLGIDVGTVSLTSAREALVIQVHQRAMLRCPSHGR